MKEERMYILNLLGEGKITADEAAKLLDTLGSKSKPKREFWDDDVHPEERLKNFSKAAADFAKEVGTKMESAYKGMEPKVKKTTKVVMKKTASVMDDISKSLNETLSNMEQRECGADCADDKDVVVVEDEKK